MIFEVELELCCPDFLEESSGNFIVKIELQDQVMLPGFLKSQGKTFFKNMLPGVLGYFTTFVYQNPEFGLNLSSFITFLHFMKTIIIPYKNI